jgi:stress response protein YsnF
VDSSKAEREPMLIVDKNGMHGQIAHMEQLPFLGDKQVLVRFESGQQVLVPREMLIPQDAGHYYLPVSIEELQVDTTAYKHKDASYASTEDIDSTSNAQFHVIPIVEEKINVQKRLREVGTVEIRKSVHERTEIVDELLKSEEVEIARVAVNRIVEEPIPIRNEGDTMIISLLEEVLVIEKRLLLREEVHIKKVQTVLHEPQEVLLREERVEVVRKPNLGEVSGTENKQ